MMSRAGRVKEDLPRHAAKQEALEPRPAVKWAGTAFGSEDRPVTTSGRSRPGSDGATDPALRVRPRHARPRRRRLSRTRGDRGSRGPRRAASERSSRDCSRGPGSRSRRSTGTSGGHPGARPRSDTPHVSAPAPRGIRPARSREEGRQAADPARSVRRSTLVTTGTPSSRTLRLRPRQGAPAASREFDVGDE